MCKGIRFQLTGFEPAAPGELRIQTDSDQIGVGLQDRVGADVFQQRSVCFLKLLGTLICANVGTGGNMQLAAATAFILIAVILGTLASLALDRFEFFGKEGVNLLIVLPIALPGIITGIALNNAFRSFRSCWRTGSEGRRRQGPSELEHSQ